MPIYSMSQGHTYMHLRRPGYEQMRLICSGLSYRHLCILGFEGRKRSLNSLSRTHSNRWCSTVSSWQLQSGQADDVLTPIRLRWLLSGMCLVLSWKIMDWSPLLSLLIGSLRFGLFIWVYMGLPLFDAAQVFIHSSLVLDLIIWQAL